MRQCCFERNYRNEDESGQMFFRKKGEEESVFLVDTPLLFTSPFSMGRLLDERQENRQDTMKLWSRDIISY